MKCKYCRSKKLDYDVSANMYFCNKCKRLLTPEEAGEIDDVKLKASFSATDAEPLEEEDLGVFTLILLGILGSLPIFDIVATSMVEWSNAKDEYKRTVVTRLIGRVLLGIIVIGIVFLIIGTYNIQLKFDIHKQVTNALKASKLLIKHEGIDLDLKAKSLNDIEFGYIFTPVEEVEEIEEFELKPDWDYINNSIITGGTFLKLLDNCAEGNFAYLIQTKQVSEKFDNTTYRNVGTITTYSSREGQNDNWYYKGNMSKEFSLIVDDYDNYISDSTDDLSNKKYIFYIDSSALFRLNILRASDDSIVGFAITEVELKSSAE